MKKLILILVLIVVAEHLLSAQSSFSNLRIKKIATSSTWQKIDSLTISPNTLRVFSFRNEVISPFYYEFFNQKIKFNLNLKVDSVWLKYRVLPIDLSTPIFRIDTSSIQKTLDGVLFSYDPFEQSNNLPDFGKLDYSGVFSRGISFGNSQNLVLNSALNLQMTGRLTNDIEILAAVSDNSIPLQPEGNTAQLQEFDKVFIQLKKKENTLLAGDYELSSPDRYFLKYFKKLQGATFSNNAHFSTKKESSLKTHASVAIARGKFSRNILDVQEGNQGPYRLRGNENERFIIALAGTEKVYWNGELLNRGQEADYVIDYNTASIQFTFRRMVNKDSRIVVEFEYTDQQYLRSLTTLDLDYVAEKFTFYGSLYSDQDGKNSIANGSLSDNEKEILSLAGDNDGIGAISSGAVAETDFNPLRINYVRIDTTICGEKDSVFRFSIDANSAVYTVRFTQVGLGNGNYVLDPNQTANGRVYRWIAPIDCLPQGEFEPILLLSAPKQQQVFTAGTKIKISENTNLHAEGSLSRFDLNRFSKIDDDDNVGGGGFLKFQNQLRLGNKIKNDWILASMASFEIANKHFNFLNRYRPQEFVRDWNLASNTAGRLQNASLSRAQEQWLKTNFSLKKSQYFLASYGFEKFLRQDNFNGTRHSNEISFKKKQLETTWNGSFLNTLTALEKTQYFRPKISVSKQFQINKNNSTSIENSNAHSSIFQIGFSAEREQNKRFDLNTDSLNQSSFLYDFLSTSLTFNFHNTFKNALTASKRWDYLSNGLLFDLKSLADDWNYSGEWKYSAHSNLNWTLNYRNLTVLSPSVIAQQSGQTYLGRINHQFSGLKGAIRANTNYQISSGQEPKIEFNYLRVNDGEGIYQWNDYNNDLIPQQNEFENAVFQDSANFVRVSVYTDEFIRSNNVLFDQNIQITPKYILKDADGIKKFIARLALQSTLQVTRGVRDLANVSPWNPFSLNIADTALIAVNATMRNTLFFNRGNRYFDLQFGTANVENRFVLTGGFQSRQTQEQFFQTRVNLSSAWTVRAKFQLFEKISDVENFDNRTYHIKGQKIEPSISWQLKNSFRTILSFDLQRMENQSNIDSENLIRQAIRLENTLNLLDKKQQRPTSIQLNFSVDKVKFNGILNSPVGFAMLEGLQNGLNYFWTFGFNKQLIQNMRLSLQYEGRKTGTSKLIHIGRAQVGLVF